MNQNSVSNAAANRKAFRLISYTLVFLIAVCVVMTIGSLLQNLMPAWHSGMIAGVLLFIVIDRLYTYRQFKYLTPFSSEWFMAFGGQWIVILLFIRFLLSYASGFDAFRADLSHWTRGDLASFFTAEFVFTIVLVLLVWYLSGQFLELLDEIGLDQQLALRDDPLPVLMDVVPAHQRLVNLIFGLGIFLVIVAALARVDMRATFSNPAGFPRLQLNNFSGAEAGALFYFVFGLALLSLSRLMSLHTHWNRHRIPVSSDNLTRRWGKHSLIFLLILAVSVSLLPAGNSVGLFSVVTTLVLFLFNIILFLSQLIIVLISLLFSLPFLLFGKPPPTFNSNPVPMPTLPPVEPVTPAPPSATWMLIRSILLWGALIAILVFAFIQFARQHEGLRAALRKSRLANWLILAWEWLSRNIDRTREKMSRTLATGWQNLLTRLEGRHLLPRMDFLSLRSLDPRQRIYFFYLAMVRRSAEQGLTRKPSQTPSEYAATLEKALPSADEDIDSITEAFIKARYSRREVDAGAAERVKAIWGRIRRALQNKSKSGESADQ